MPIILRLILPFSNKTLGSFTLVLACSAWITLTQTAKFQTFVMIFTVYFAFGTSYHPCLAEDFHVLHIQVGLCSPCPESET